MEIRRLLFPALRWTEDGGFEPELEAAGRAAEAGVAGFILFGGEAGTVREAIADLRARSPHPLLVASDLERGAGQQFRGATPLPPLAALGRLDDPEITRRAGRLTAREAVALGVNWVYAPVADLDIQPLNPIVGTRAFGSDPRLVARHVKAWIRGCAEGGALSCAKHFPGHGRTTADSHVELPEVTAGSDVLEADLLPFRAAVEAAADAFMTAHVAYPALDPSGRPATLSPTILQGLLREKLGFEGLAVTDALNMEGVLEDAVDEGEAAVRALAAGCDALLYPSDYEAVAGSLAEALGRELSEARVTEALGRVAGAAERAAGPAVRAGAEGRARRGGGGEWGRAEDRAWALDVAARSVVCVRGIPELPEGRISVVTVDDDLGGPYPPPPRDAFPLALAEAGVRVIGAREHIDRQLGSAPPQDARLVVAVYSDIRAWKGRPGLSKDAIATVERALAADPRALVVLFGHPRLATELPGDCLLCAWGGEPLMQSAAAHIMAGK